MVIVNDCLYENKWFKWSAPPTPTDGGATTATANVSTAKARTYNDTLPIIFWGFPTTETEYRHLHMFDQIKTFTYPYE